MTGRKSVATSSLTTALAITSNFGRNGLVALVPLSKVEGPCAEQSVSSVSEDEIQFVKERLTYEC
jgi:hypothetical protein